MELSPCLAVVKNIAEVDSDNVLDRVDSLRASGVPAGAAQRAAVEDALADLQSERDELERLAAQKVPDSLREPAPVPPRFQRDGGYQLPKFTQLNEVTQSIQDRYNRWQQAIESVQEQGGTVTETNNFYRAEERYWGVVGSKVEDFKAQVDDWVERVVNAGLSPDAVGMYAYAQHARERNAWIAAKRPGMPDGGSGMTNETADHILEAARRLDVDDELAAFANEMRQWIQGTRDVLYDGGLIDETTYLTWNALFDQYVPLRGLAGVEEQRRTGRGFNIRGPEGFEAKGRYSEAANIVEQVLQDRTRALIRVGKNDVLRSFGQFVLDNPSPNLWDINAVERRPIVTVDENGDRIIEERQQIINDDRTVHFKDSGREISVLVRDKILRDQLQAVGQDDVKLGWLLGHMQWANRYLSHVYTTLSPTFTVLNAARDLQSATMATVDELGYHAVPKLLANMPTAYAEAFRAEGRDFSPDYQLFRSTGGKTAFFGLKTVDELVDELSDTVRQAEQSVIDPRRLGRAALNLVEHMNGTVENATRLALFKTARQEGMSLAQAASFAKNATTNFNRKGLRTPELAAWLLFANPAIQSTRKIAERMTNPKVAAAVGAGMAGVFGLALQNASMGDDDDGVAWWDKIPSETKDRNLIIVLPPGSKRGEAIPGSKTGRYIKIPMAYGYNWFATFANEMADVYRHSVSPKRGRDWKGTLTNLAASAMGSFVPLREGGEGIKGKDAPWIQAILPSVYKPLAQNVMNLNTFGRPIYPEENEKNRGTPDSRRYFQSQAGTIFQRGAEALSDVTGGTKYEGGLIDITPGSFENALRQYGGGPVQFSMDLLNAMYARQSIRREDLDTKRLPFVKQLFSTIDAETDRGVAYERMDKIEKAENKVKAAMEQGDRQEARRIADESDGLSQLGGVLQTTRERLTLLRKQELAVIQGDAAPATKYSRVMEIEARRRQVLQDLNRAYDATIEKHFGKPSR